MRRREIDVTAARPRPPEAVYGLLADGSSWPAVEPDRVGRARAGRATRRPRVSARSVCSGMGRTTGRDQILELVPNRELKYASLSGLPVRDYVGEVDLEAAPGGGTRIHWHSSFVPKRPGTGWILERGIAPVPRALVRVASLPTPPRRADRELFSPIGKFAA